MDNSVVWVHGIGPTQAGYSQRWTEAYNECLGFPTTNFIEVLWSDVYSSTPSVQGPSTNGITLPLATQELLAEGLVRKNVTTVLRARVSALAQSPEWVAQWTQDTSKAATGQATLPYWLVNSEDYIGQFVKYLVNQDVRDAVKAKMKEQLLPLTGADNCSVVAHSWGTVVAYEALLDLETEAPDFHLAHFFTVGSPLWLVQYWLEDPTGRKPSNVGNWVNIHAVGDPIGAALAPAFQVDADYAVPGMGDGNPHGSYFAPGNVAVQCDIIAATILGNPVVAVTPAEAVLLTAKAALAPPADSNQI